MATRKLNEVRWTQLRYMEAREREAWAALVACRHDIDEALKRLRKLEDVHCQASHDYSSMAVMAIAELEEV